MLAASGGLMAFVMAPSALFTMRLQRHFGAGPLELGGFIAGYLVVWIVIGAAAMLAFEGLDQVGGAVVVAAVGIGAAAYQASPLARRFLYRCRSPLGLLLTSWRPGMTGAVRVGGVYGLWCAGCCAGLVAGLVVLGMMGLPGMAVMGAIVLAEKRTAFGVMLSRGVAVALTAAVVVVAA
jgi:predicted metal-binding membrane protein